MRLPQPADSQSLADHLSSQSGLTHTQAQIWTAQKVHPDSPFANMAFVILVEGQLDEARFRAAWQSVISQNRVLRSCIREHEGRPYLDFHDADSCQCRVMDFSAEPDPEAAFRRWATERCAQPLPLEGELIDSTLARLAEDRFGWYLNQHHLITDAASTVHLFKAVSAAYQGAAQEPFPDYYETSSQVFGQTETARRESIRHWQNRPSSSSRQVALYGKRGNAAATQSERIEVQLSPQQSSRLRALAEEPPFSSFFPDVSLFGMFSALLAATLHRLSGQDRVAFDSPAGNRPSQAARQSLGCFIEMFPLDFHIEAGATFRSLGEQCMREVQDFLAHVAPAASDPSGTRVGSAVLNYFPQSFGDFAGIPVHADWIHSGHIDGVYDAKLQVHDYNGAGAFTLQFDLSSDTLSSYDRRRLPIHFMNLLRAMLESLDTRLASVDILADEERERILGEFNRDFHHPPPSDTLLHRIARTVEAHPDRIALRQGHQELTYRELWSQVEAVARSLRPRVAEKDACIAVLMPRSIDAVIAILGILRAGAAYLPLDVAHPAARISRILEDAQPIALIRQGSPSDLHALPALPCLAFRQLLAEIDDEPGLSYPDADDLAYVIYTSGSTGQPKGVEVEHRSLIDYLDWAEEMYVRGEPLAFPLFTSLAFDLTVTSLFLPFMTGGELVVYAPQATEVDSSIIDVIQDNRVDIVKLTPSHLSLLKQLDLAPSRIRGLVLGGEDLKAGLAAQVSRQFSHPVEIYNEYGPTEAVVGCMIHKFDPASAQAASASVPIGRPARRVALYLVNHDLALVPEGAPGELCIARPQLARGYRNRPAETEATFLQPASPHFNGQRIYRSGDLARFSAKGELTYLGRIDHQVKISGHRIEPGEIETALERHPRIAQAFVTTFRPASRRLPTSEAAHCRQCGISSRYPSVTFDGQGVCSICRSYTSIKEEAENYFSSPAELRAIFERSRQERDPLYDCMVFYSGGKDSTYALCKLVDMGLRVYGFTLDNGYLSEQAKQNIGRVVETLGIAHEFASTPAMNEIFRDSLARFSNVCNGCFKTIYTLGMQRALELDIPIIVTGLSRGQFFETRLTESLFARGSFQPDDVDRAVLEARKRYHREEDAVSRCLDVSFLQSDEPFEQVQFVDFYRYWDASLEELYAYLEKRVPWIRPTDTGRSTNCLVNDVGIYVHQKERGFHNYELPYSWDVRLGHKKRDEALRELDDRFDLKDIRRMLAEIGYDENRLSDDPGRNALAAYYVASEEIGHAELGAHLARELPSSMQPTHFIRLDAMPLTANGKIDRSALPQPQTDSGATDDGRSMVAPEGPVEEYIHELWTNRLGRSSFSVHDSFFRLGGTSLTAMEITLQICQEYDIDLPLQTIFQRPTVSQLSSFVEERLLQEIESLSDEEAEKLLKQR